MSDITKSDLITRVLQHIGALASGEEATAHDSALVDGAIDAAFGELEKFGGVSFTTSAIPDWAQDALRDRVAYVVAHAFGIPSQRIVEFASVSNDALGLLLRHASALAESDTAADLRNKVLQKLQKLRPGEIAPASHSEMVSDAIVSIFGWYAERGKLGFEADAIPTWAMPFLRDVVAYNVCVTMGIADANLIGLLKAQSDVAIGELDSRMSPLTDTSTRDKLRNDVLQNLGILGTGQVATASQKKVVGDIIDRCFGQLATHGVISFTTTTIPDWAMLPLRDYVSGYAALPLNASPQRMEIFLAERTEAFRELKAQSQQAISGEPVRTVSY